VLLNPTNPAAAPAWRVMEGAGRALELTLYPIEVRGAEEFERTFAAIAAAHADALYVFQDYLVFAHRTRLVDFAVQHRLPLICMYREWADAVGLLAYGASLREELLMPPAAPGCSAWLSAIVVFVKMVMPFVFLRPPPPSWA
jgi:putative tryptophan/tyrosine transport system substrate-binding protein